MPHTTTQPWLKDIRGTQVLPIINLDDDTIRIIAGPGTGKTFGLVRRVQRILHPHGYNAPGNEILVVAFNRVIAKQLKEDIDRCLAKSPHDGDPDIRTIHALCLEVIGNQIRILLPHEREAMIYDVLCQHPTLHERYEKYNNTDQALHNHEAKHILDMQLWQAVQRWLKRHQAQLISDLPIMLLNRLQGGDFSDRTYSHVIVDEFQDLTSGEQELILKLRRKGGKIVVLGDPRQSIYAFRGNDREGLSKIEKLIAPSLGKVKDITMIECQRCPTDIVNAANQLMGLYESQPMTGGSTIQANMHLVVWKTLESEAKGMAKAIVENIHAKPNDDHLVMVTRRQFGYYLREKISEIDSELKIELNFSEGLLETWAVREAFLYFCLIVNPDAPTWRAWLGYKNSTDGKDFKASQRNADSYLQFLKACGDRISEEAIQKLAENVGKLPGKGGSNLRKRAKRFVELKRQLKWDGNDAISLLHEVFDVNRWGLDESSDSETSRLDMDLLLAKACDICKEYQSKKQKSTPLDQLRIVAQTLRYQIATREPFVSGEKCNLKVTTLWGAKGLNAVHVYVIGLCKEAIPGIRRDEYPGTDDEYYEEQRRLFYVSITRSKHTLVLSRVKSIKWGQAKQLGLIVKSGKKYWANLEMSPFLHDIIDYLPMYQAGEDWLGCVVKS